MGGTSSYGGEPFLRGGGGGGDPLGHHEPCVIVTKIICYFYIFCCNVKVVLAYCVVD